MNDSASFERRLSGLFDRQRFFRDPALDSLIAETAGCCFGGRALSDDDLDLVSAAGEDPRTGSAAGEAESVGCQCGGLH